MQTVPVSSKDSSPRTTTTSAGDTLEQHHTIPPEFRKRNKMMTSRNPLRLFLVTEPFRASAAAIPSSESRRILQNARSQAVGVSGLVSILVRLVNSLTSPRKMGLKSKFEFCGQLVQVLTYIGPDFSSLGIEFMRPSEMVTCSGGNQPIRHCCTIQGSAYALNTENKWFAAWEWAERLWR